MKINLSNLSINQKLAIVAFVLGFVAIFMRDPINANVVSVDAKELAMKMQDKSNYVSVLSLAESIIEKRADFTLIDLREETKYNEYNIPGSINVKPSEILNLDLKKTQKLILYSEDNTQAAQAWFLLKSRNFKSVYILYGGLNEWKDKILFPVYSDNFTEKEKSEFTRIVEISKFFGGTPRSKSTDETAITTTQTMPKVAPPINKPSGPKTGKPKREGC